MTENEKDLLLKDLSSRLPYGIKIDNYGEPSILISINNRYRIIVEIFEVGNKPKLDVLEIDDCKPYLFPLSSMTEEQKKEYDSIIYHNIELHCERYYDVIDVDCYEELHDFYHKNHLDYRNLIGKGLAIDATGLGIYENR